MKAFQSVLLSFLSVLCIVGLVAAQDCSASNPCKIGCCSKFGFCGLGPDFCAQEICVANCDQKSQCDPGGYGAEYVNHTTCPLNVCCSKFGFCGMTDEFCGDNKPKQPSCSRSSTFERVVGYYEAWAIDRPCNVFLPEQIPLGVYTHLNYAFASIDPVTFEVVPSSTSDPDMYRRLTDLKWRDPSLKVFIAIGGWTFNDEGQKTRTTFGDIARSEANQQKFISSLISFMSTYNFDGVDLDWEYPQAPDRGGTADDYKGFPQFMANLRSALRGTGGRDGISITLPASYWYLQHFDVKELVKHVDFFNIMSYDIHGVWDIPNKWTGPYLNAHTNLTEIKDALDLLWRNDIPADKVTMGLAFYGRGFTANDPGCMTPGCSYGSGSTARKCSHEVGVLLNSEIQDVMSTQGRTPTLYNDAAVKVLTYDTNQWVAFDDAETLELKVDFAKDKCLGGVMVWAVSHDTQNASYSRALARIAKPSKLSIIPDLSVNMNGVVRYDQVRVAKQCLWANCGDPCPAGYSAQRRSDDGASSSEIMLGPEGCKKGQLKVYCCPSADPLPLCGWYDHRNGNCIPNCPVGSVEVGSNSQHCHKTGRQGILQYQAACCSPRWTDSNTDYYKNMRLVSQCSWGEFPYCDTSCKKGSMLVSSLDGTGGATCKYGGIGSKHERPLCCDQPDNGWKYDECEWYKNIGSGPSGDRDCRSGCPADKVQVAMSSAGCRSGSAAYCCRPKAKSKDKRNSNLAEMKWALDLYMRNPTCPADMTKDLGPRGLDGVTPAEFTKTPRGYIAVRKTELARDVVNAVESIVEQFMASDMVDNAVVNLWESAVVPLYPYLTVSYLRDWGTSVVGWYGRGSINSHSSAWNIYFLCRLGLYGMNQQIRWSRIALDQWQCIPSSIVICEIHLVTIDKKSLSKRTRDPITWSVTIGANTYSRTSTSQPYRSANDWSTTNPMQVEIYGDVYYFPGPGCTTFELRRMNLVQQRLNGPLPNIATEHEIEIQTLPLWYKAAMRGELVGGAANPAGAIAPSFFMQTITRQGAVRTMQNPPDAASGGADLWTVEDRLFNALGSTLNDRVFVLTDSELNCLKAVIWGLSDNLIAADVMGALTTHADVSDSETALGSIRNAVSIFTYMNEAVIHGNMRTILMDIRRELRIAERLHAELNGGATVAAVSNFDNWIQSHFTAMHSNLERWATPWLNIVVNLWANDRTNGPTVRTAVAVIRARITNSEVDTTGFFDPV